MTDGATDLINLWKMPDDAYQALVKKNPHHEFCKLYEEEWIRRVPKPQIWEKVGEDGMTLAIFIQKFTDAMWEAADVTIN